MTNDRRATVVVTILATVLAASLAGTVAAVVRGRGQQRLAVSRGLTLQAASLRATEPITALRLGIAAMRIHAEPPVRAGLQTTLGAGRRTATFTDETGAIRDAAFAPDGRTLATATGDDSDTTGLTALWDLRDPLQPRRIAILIVTLPGHTAGVSTVAFTADGRGVVNAIKGGTAERWDVTDPKAPRRTSVFADSGLEVVRFSPDRRTLVGFRDEAAELWDLTDWNAPRRTATLPGGPARGVAFSPDGRTLATMEGNNAFNLWDITDRAAPHRTADVAVNVDTLAFGPDGHTLATVDTYGGGSALWDVSDRTAPRRTAHLTGPLHAVAFSPDGRTFAAADDDGTGLWDLAESGAPRWVGTLTGSAMRPDRMTFSPDGRVLLASRGGAIEWWGVSRVADVAADPVGEACRVAGGGLTAAEWRRYVPELSYRPTCSRA